MFIMEIYQDGVYSHGNNHLRGCLLLIDTYMQESYVCCCIRLGTTRKGFMDVAYFGSKKVNLVLIDTVYFCIFIYYILEELSCD